MDNPKKDLVEAIVELREDVEQQLKANKYYIALHKLDELLAAIKPLEGIEGTAKASASAMPAPEPSMAEPKDESERTWSGVVKENVGQSAWQSGAPEAP
jgi:hypothetical protein